MKQLRRVAQLLAHLHAVGCGRDKAGNRELHFDDYVLLVLLYLFNPLIDSLRTLQRTADLPEVQERLGIGRFSLGSFSESCRVFEPRMLQQVVDQLAGQMRLVGRDELFRQLPGKLTLVDSTVIDTLSTVAKAMYLPLSKGRHRHAWRLHLHLDVEHHVPGPWEVTDARNSGKSDEKNVLRSKLQPDHTYVLDRWYAQFVLWNDIRAARSSYVCRIRDHSLYDVLESRPLSEEAVAAGVISDEVVELGLSVKPQNRADHPTRLICVKCTPHQKRGKGKRQGGGRTGPSSDGVLRIVTDLLDVPAHVIAFLYQYRWTIEICQPWCLHCDSFYESALWGLGRVRSGSLGLQCQLRGQSRRRRRRSTSPASAHRIHRPVAPGNWRACTQPRPIQRYSVGCGMPSSRARSLNHHSPSPSTCPEGQVLTCPRR